MGQLRNKRPEMKRSGGRSGHFGSGSQTASLTLLSADPENSAARGDQVTATKPATTSPCGRPWKTIAAGCLRLLPRWPAALTGLQSVATKNWAGFDRPSQSAYGVVYRRRSGKIRRLLRLGSQQARPHRRMRLWRKQPCSTLKRPSH